MLVPILFLRKIMIASSNISKSEIIKKGMDTQPKFILVIINILKYIELKLLNISLLGSSLISIVKKWAYLI